MIWTTTAYNDPCHDRFYDQRRTSVRLCYHLHLTLCSSNNSSVILLGKRKKTIVNPMKVVGFPVTFIFLSHLASFSHERLEEFEPLTADLISHPLL